MLGVARQRFHTESRIRESRTLRLCHATASQAGSMRGMAQDATGKFHGWREETEDIEESACAS